MSSISMSDMLLMENTSSRSPNRDVSVTRVATERSTFGPQVSSIYERMRLWCDAILGILRKWCSHGPHVYVLLPAALLIWLCMIIGTHTNDIKFEQGLGGTAWLMPTGAICVMIGLLAKLFEICRVVSLGHYSSLAVMRALGNDNERMAYVLVSNNENQPFSLDRVLHSDLTAGHIVVHVPGEAFPYATVLINLPEAKLPLSLMSHFSHHRRRSADVHVQRETDAISFEVPIPETSASHILSKIPVALNGEDSFPLEIHISHTPPCANDSTTQIQGLVRCEDEATHFDELAYLPAGSKLTAPTFTTGMIVDPIIIAYDTAQNKSSPWRNPLTSFWTMMLPVLCMWLCYVILCCLFGDTSTGGMILAVMAYLPASPFCVDASVKIIDWLSALRLEKKHRLSHQITTQVYRHQCLRQLYAARGAIVDLSILCQECNNLVAVTTSPTDPERESAACYCAWVGWPDYTENDVKKYAVLCHLVSGHGSDDTAQWIAAENISIRRIQSASKDSAQFVIGMSHVQQDDVEMLYIFADEADTSPLKSMIVRVNQGLHIVSWGSLARVHDVCVSESRRYPDDGCVPITCYATRSISEADLIGLDLPTQELSSALGELRARLEKDLFLVGGFIRKATIGVDLQPGARELMSTLRAKSMALCLPVTAPPFMRLGASLHPLLQKLFDDDETSFVYLRDRQHLHSVRMEHPSLPHAVCVIDKACMGPGCEDMIHEFADLLNTCVGIVICGYSPDETCALLDSWKNTISPTARSWIGIGNTNQSATGIQLLATTEVKFGIDTLTQPLSVSAIQASFDILTTLYGAHLIIEQDEGSYPERFSSFIKERHVYKDAIVLTVACWALVATKRSPNDWLMNLSAQIAYHGGGFIATLIAGYEYALKEVTVEPTLISSALREGVYHCGQGILMGSLLAMFICMTFYGQPLISAGDALAFMWSACLTMALTITLIQSSLAESNSFAWYYGALAVVTIGYFGVSTATTTFIQDAQYQVALGALVELSSAPLASWIAVSTFGLALTSMFLLLGRNAKAYHSHNADQRLQACQSSYMWSILAFSCLMLASAGGLFCFLTSLQTTSWMRVPYGRGARGSSIQAWPWTSTWNQPWRATQSYGIDNLGCVVHHNSSPVVLTSSKGMMVYIDMVLPTHLTDQPSPTFATTMASMTGGFCEKVHQQKAICEWAMFHVLNDSVRFYEITSIPGTRYPIHTLGQLQHPSHGLVSLFQNVTQAIDMVPDVRSPRFQWWVLSTALTRFPLVRVPLGITPVLGQNKSFLIQIVDNGFPAIQKTILISSDVALAFNTSQIGLATFVLVGTLITVVMCNFLIEMSLKRRRFRSEQQMSSWTFSLYGRGMP